jgi:hypothetical protein
MLPVQPPLLILVFVSKYPALDAGENDDDDESMKAIAAPWPHRPLLNAALNDR